MADTKDPKDPKNERLFPNAANVTDSFRQANPAVFGRTNGNVDSVRRVAMIDARVGSIKERLHDHVARHWTKWVDDEAGQLMAKRAAPHRTLTPKDNRQPIDAAIRGQAHRNVQARMTRRFTKLNETKVKIQNAINNTDPKQRPVPEQNNKQPLSQTNKKKNDPKQ